MIKKKNGARDGQSRPFHGHGSTDVFWSIQFGRRIKSLQKTTGQSLKHGGADAGDTLFFSFFRKGYAFIVSYGVGEVPESKSPYP